MSAITPNWICCQIGAREHYSVPRALHRCGVLESVITETWVKPHHLLRHLHPRLAQRYHPDLASADVKFWNMRSLLFEAIARRRSMDEWGLFMHRNEWFQRRALRHLKALARKKPSVPRILFSYSYSAKRLFEFAKSQGWTTILGQIDPGPPEEEIVKRVQAKLQSGVTRWIPAPQCYWKDWFEECELADAIVVNSEWSREAMSREGTPEEKISVIPLAYEPSVASQAFTRSFAQAFSKERPLRVLFLGQITLRKGVSEILSAVELLEGEPVLFEMVGPMQMEIPDKFRIHPQVHWFGSVPRADTPRHYKAADLFLFPTHSDGFGLTQLEAQAWQLPLIASRFCGNVVRHDVNGLLLSDITGASIAEAVLHCIRHPERLSSWSKSAVIGPQYSLNSIGAQLSDLALRLCDSRSVKLPQ